MVSPTATSLAMEYSLDPKVSRAGVKDVRTSFLPRIPVRSCSATPGALFSTGVNTGAVGSYIYDKDPEGTVQP